VTGSIGPSYQLVADDIRARITSGEYQVGQPIPSTAALRKQYGASSTVVRHAVEQLRDGGILVGHPGKAVYVQATPEAAASEQRDVKVLGGQVAELARRVDAIGDGALRDLVTQIEVNLMELYGKLGYDYPRQAGQRGNGRRARNEQAG
jgi:GntR family transcriptional regulator